jgi:GT2 family glycosyltransferase
MISVCVAVYKAHTPPNLASIGAELEQASLGWTSELVVALNGITAQAAEVPAGAEVVDLRVNMGVAPGWNAAARAARGEILIFCNDDVRLGRGSLALLAETLQAHPQAGVVGPAGSSWDIDAGRHVAWVEPPVGSTGELAECDVVSGFLFACRKGTWEQVGGFDEFYAPASWEEVDFCTAVRAEGGRCYVVSGIEQAHAWGVSRRQMPWARARWNGRSETWRSIHRRNRRHFLAKWQGQPVASASA